MFSWFRKPKRENKTDKKFEEYEARQKDFIETANFTIGLTKDIANTMKGKMDSYLRHIETTAKILSDALLVVDNLGLVQRINPAGQKMFGWKQDDLRSKRVTNLFITKDGKNITYERLMEILHKENCFDYNVVMDGHIAGVRGLRLDKTTFDIDVSASTYINSEGEETTLLLIRDVTEAEKLRDNLQRSEEHYKAIFETSFDGIAIVRDFHVIEANKSFISLFGNKVLSGDFSKFIKEPYVEQFINSHERHMDGEDCSFEFEVTCKKHDGKNIDVIFSSALVGSEDGDYASLITIKDITFRKLMENKFKESEQKYKNIFEQSFNGVAVVQDSRIVAINPSLSTMIGFQREELINTDFTKYVHEDSLEEVIGVHTRRMNGSKELAHYILKLNCGDHTKMCSATSNYVVWNGRPACLLSVVPLE